MKTSHRMLAAAAGALSLAIAGTAVAAPVNVKIIAFNDFHGNLQAPGDSFGGKLAFQTGGADYLAAYVAKLRAQNPDNNVLVHAGDMVGASPLISALYRDEPTIEVMNRIGVDLASVGNHEFDHGKTELLRLQSGGCHPTDPNSCQGAAVGTPMPFEGAKFKYLAANVIENATGKPLFPRYVIKTFGGVRMAFIGMTLEGTPSIVSPSGVAGLTFNDEAQTVNSLIRTLRNQGVNAIVVVVHEGGAQSGPSPPFGGCNGFTGAIVDIVRTLDNSVDLIVSGHTHEAYVCQLQNVAGRSIPVTSAAAFGRLLTNIDVVLDTETRDVVSITAAQVLVDRTDPTITPNAQIATLVANYNTIVKPLANKVIGKIASTFDRGTTAACEHKAGDLIADSQLAATAAPAFGGAVVAFMNPGGVRAAFSFASSGEGEGDGNVTYGEAFTVQPFGNSLVTLTLTGDQIRTMLEQQFVGCSNGQTFNRVLHPSAGFEYAWTHSIPGTCNRVDPASIKINGVVVDPLSSYRVTVNNFLADGGDKFAVLKNGTHRLGGAQDIDAVTEYLKPTLLPAPGGTPLAPAPLTRIKRLDNLTRTCPDN